MSRVSQQSTRKLGSLVAGGVILALAGWLDSQVLAGLLRTANQNFDPLPFTWVTSFGFILVAGAVLAVALLARWAHSPVVGLVYALVGGLVVFVGPLIWLGADGVNGAPPFLPDPLGGILNNIYLYGEQGPLNAAAIVGGAMLLVGLASIGSALRNRERVTPSPIETAVQPKSEPNPL